MSGRVAFVYGRFNPPTIGHEHLMKLLKDTPAHDRWIYLSPSHDHKNNPLSHERRVQLVKKAFYDSKVLISDMQHKDMFAVLQHLNRGMGYSEVTVVVGSDRSEELRKRIPMYNGKLYQFTKIEVVALGRTKGDGVLGMSASKLREAAKLNRYDDFENGLPTKLRPMAQTIFEEVRNACLLDHLEST